MSKKTFSTLLSIIVGLIIGLGLMSLGLFFIGKEVWGQTGIRTIKVRAILDMNREGGVSNLVDPSGNYDAATLGTVTSQIGLGDWIVSGDNAYRSGNVGIGTTSPQAKLHIKTTAAGVGCSGTAASCSEFSGDLTGCKTQSGCVWEAPYCKGTATPCSSFSTQASCNGQFGCSWGAVFARDAYFEYGSVGIGVANPSYRLELPNIADQRGRARANSWTTYSSIRWKENIIPIVDALKKLIQVQGVYFNWKPEYGGTKGIGLIAEQVGKIIPEVVEYESDGIYAKSLDYDHLVALVIEAIKEQQEQINQLKQEIQELRAIINKE